MNRHGSDGLLIRVDYWKDRGESGIVDVINAWATMAPRQGQCSAVLVTMATLSPCLDQRQMLRREWTGQRRLVHRVLTCAARVGMVNLCQGWRKMSRAQWWRIGKQGCPVMHVELH